LITGASESYKMRRREIAEVAYGEITERLGRK
jgi:hypothetical protein